MNSVTVTAYRVPEILVSRLAQRMWLYVSQSDRGNIRCPVSSYLSRSSLIHKLDQFFQITIEQLISIFPDNLLPCFQA